MKPDICANGSSGQHSSYNNGNSNVSNRIRVIRLRRRNNVPLGFSVRGGREHGIGIFVSEVKAGTEAHHQGLLVGDQILRINGFNIEHAIHEEVLALLRAKPGVVIKVKSMGMIPVKDTKKDPLTWKIVEPGPTTTELNETNMGRTLIEKDSFESRISIPSIGSAGLGCSIVKGPPDVRGIYVQSVKSGSLAEKAGLQIGDRIMEMNGHNFTNLDFPDAVTMLKSSKQMTLVLLKGVGLDLFPDEKIRRFQVHRTPDKKSMMLEEDNPRDERETEEVKGLNCRVKNGSDVKLGKDGNIRLNGGSSCPESHTSTHPLTVIQDSATTFGNDIKVCATVHSSCSEMSGSSFVSRDTRESGDGMDFESLSENCNPRNNCQSPWTNGNYNNGHTPDQNGKSCDSSCSDIEPYHPNLNYMKELLKNNHVDVNTRPKFYSDQLSDEKLSTLSTDSYIGIPKIPTRFSENAFDPKTEDYVKPPNEFLKRKQHELLMEEFREVHKKMFGLGPIQLSKAPNNCEFQDQSNLYKRRQQVRKDRHVLPPPPETGISSDLSEKIGHNLEPINQNLCDNSKEVTHKKRQREPPITDSRASDPKPPHTYFDKPEGLKPLVTIGPYATNSQQNRFLTKAALANKISSDAKTIPTASATDADKRAFNQTISHSSSNSNAPSTTPSQSRSPTTDSVLSSDDNYKSSIEKDKSDMGHIVPNCDYETNVPKSFRATLFQFSKSENKFLEKGKNDGRDPSKDGKSSLCTNGPISNSKQIDLNEELLKKSEVVCDRRIKEIILKKNGPLNFAVEGGINSDSDGKIIVSEVWTGSCTSEGGEIEIGDQILMVDNTKLTGLSLTAAKIVLRNANSNTNTETKFLIAKLKELV